MSIKKKYRQLSSIILLALCSVFNTSCEDLMRDNLDHCVLYVQFNYDYNMSKSDLFSEQVEKVYVYIFDPSGRYISTYEGTSQISDRNEYKLILPRSLRGNTAVVWAGRIYDNYILPTMEVGDRIDKLTLQYRPTSNASNIKIADLWHSGPEVLEFNEKDNNTQTLALVRNTNTINVQLRLADNTIVYAPDFYIKITTANCAYNYKNDFLIENPYIDYTPYSISDDATASIQTLRMVKGNTMMLSIVNRKTGIPMKIDGQDQLDLMKYFALRTPDDMTIQEYLDRCYIWDLNVAYNSESSIVISISINGWTVWFQGTDIEPTKEK